MNQAILTSEVQFFLRDRIQTSPSVIALQKSSFPNVSSSELADQLDGMQRAQKKLPRWFNTANIYYPGLLALEQSSSSLTGLYKSELIDTGSSVLDITGGFGVDDYYFAQRAKQVFHCERNEALSEIAEHNAKQLGATNIRFLPRDGLDYLQSAKEIFDFIYVDPSRRVKQQKVFRLSDCEPNVVIHIPLFKQKSKNVFIKAAPLLDIQAAIKELPGISEVHIISVRNECKELLFALRDPQGGPITFHCAALNSNFSHTLCFTERDERESIPVFDSPQRYLYEPDAALLKAGCFKYTAIHFTLSKLHQHTHLYTSDILKEDFIGRCFEVIKITSYSDFKKCKKPIQGNVSTRNFPLKPEDLRKRHKIKDGGDQHLFFCTGPRDELLVVTGRKIR
ncbi:class I SAM-dependent methyltransferase [Olivibacter sp. CPCC 100613]|uniref:class I SAM-dependent methyltransferase n=1 Tax=Olivibacter sp. CPCC 100613 TaxID=3079931 RepID=UPI002FF9EC41